MRTGNKDGFLSLDFGQAEFGVDDVGERLRRYWRFLYETGAIGGKGAKIDPGVLKKERGKNYKLTRTDRFAHRTRHFADSGIIGTKEFVSETFGRFGHLFQSKKEKTPTKISGLDRIYSLNRLVWTEPHYGLPLLSVLPRPLAHLYVRMTKKADHYHELLYTYWGLKKLANKFSIADYSKTIIHNPVKYHIEYMIPPGSLKSAIARLISDKFVWLSPSFIWILEKPKDRQSAHSRGSAESQN